ncbi:MAG: TOMM precursor leader peptide-binding protein [Symplocastrum torsivum CPER-KK1]|jgi:ribosomal protein S12 methylthiotransferase accessory factor|uniref:TOMM leader peptide-binding protein n=1 Tax=Symplocastrum torsivum CPER-KK1 TaxID=450513 RepID=A0A951PTD5_9CYAN|nr:TOMM precursor leader peptide-binding protein [Symplocastrum torsivum CPER-KK1]
MLKKPVFKPHFHVEVIEPSSVYLLSEHEHHALSSHLYTLLAPLLDGQHNVDDIVQHLEAEVSMLGVYNALTRLESQGYLAEADQTLPSQQAAFWSLLGTDSETALSKLKNTRVSVVSFGNVETKEFISALKSLNINVDEQADITETDLTIVLTDDYLQIGLSEFNQEAEARQKPWLLVKPVGTVIWLGPLFVPPRTGCWECLAQRLQGKRTVETSIAQQKGATEYFSTSRAVLPVSLQMGINWAALETAKQIVIETPSQLEGKIFTFNTTQLSIEQHILVKRPQCQVCGVSVKEEKPQVIALQSQKKRFTLDGGHRGFSPEETLKKYSHHISPITGVISELLKLESDNNLIHVYTASHLNRKSSNNLVELRQNLSSNSAAGKGKTDSQSKASCLCEALERYSGIFTGNEYRLKGTYAQLESIAIHPNDCAQYSTTQYQQREVWNAQHGGFAWVPEAFDEDKEIEWTPVWSLTEQKFKYLPTAYCYYDYPQVDGHRFCMGDSNGNAAGNTLEEAILQGFMELVERDSVALWWYNRIQRPAVDLASFDEPYLKALRDYYQSQNNELWVIDITSDLNIPSFAAIAIVRGTNQTSELIALGFGTHFDPKIAILRAVTEVNQFLAMLSHHQTTKEFDNPDLEYWYKEATLSNQPYLVPDPSAKPKVYADYPKYCSSDLKQDVLTCVEIAANHGLETLVLDQTRPDIGLSVVKVIVPGLRHFWCRFAPGRLYDVPVQMGWLSTPLKEEQLNPIPMFF